MQKTITVWPQLDRQTIMQEMQEPGMLYLKKNEKTGILIFARGNFIVICLILCRHVLVFLVINLRIHQNFYYSLAKTAKLMVQMKSSSLH